MPQASEWWPALASALKDPGDKYGPFSVLLILFLVFFVWYTHRLWTGRLRDKDKEIERLVIDRNRLQEITLSNRLDQAVNDVVGGFFKAMLDSLVENSLLLRILIKSSPLRRLLGHLTDWTRARSMQRLACGF